MSERPVFVVGPSRSGTTLMAACLNSSPDLHIGAETHYLDDLRPRMQRRARSPLSPEDAATCEAYFVALAHGAYGMAAARRWKPADDRPDARVERSALRAEAEARGTGSDAWFEAFCRLQAHRAGKERWGEKTPRHVFRIGEILERWPEARVLCMVRDPRAVVASYRSFARAAHRERRAQPPQWAEWAAEDRARIARSQHPAILALLWRGAVRASLAAASRDPRVWILRYEDLVAEPEGQLERLCEWVGIRYDPAFLAKVPRMNSSFGDRQSNAGISDASLERWRDDLDPRSIAAIQFLCRGTMRRFGYESIPIPGAPLHTARALTELPWAFLRTVHANRGRIASLPAYLARRSGMGLPRRSGRTS